MFRLLAALAAFAVPPDTTHLVLVASTDVHGHATEWDFVADQPFPGGITRAATVVDSLRARYPGRVVVVDAGDLISGDPFADYYARIAPRDPHPVVESLDLAGYDVATPGNHDYDYGIPVLTRATSRTTIRFVSANIRGLPGDTLIFPAYTVVRRGDLRVGVAGFTTPGVMVWNRHHLRGRIRVAPVEPSAARVMPGLRRESDIAILVVHSGLEGESSYDTTGVGPEDMSARLAGLSPKPDIVVVGHSHREIVDTVIDGVHFVQPKPYAQSLAVVHVTLRRRFPGDAWRVDRIRGESVPLGNVTPSPRLANRLAKLRSEVRAWASQSLGEARGDMPAALARAEPTPVMNLVHEVQRKRSGAELSSVSAFNLRAGLTDGDILLRHIFALYPYENTLRAVRLSGAQLKDYLEQSARYFTSDSLGRPALNPAVFGYNYDMVAGASYDIDLRLPPGARIRNLAVNGRPVAPSNSFTLAVNSYRQSGGGGFDMLRDAPVVYDRGENIRDLLIDEVRARRVIDPETLSESSWRIVPPEAASRVRALFGAPAAPPTARSAETVLARLLVLGEFRGAVTPRAAALATALDSAEAACRCPTVRVAPGGLLRGAPASDLAAGRPAVEVLNRLGLTASALGARDAGWSLDTLRQRVVQSRFAWLAANLVDSATGRRPDWAASHRVVESGGLRIGLIGYLPPSALPELRAAGLAGLEARSGATGLAEALAAVKREHADLTVVLTGAALSCSGTDCGGEAVDLAQALGTSGVDVIVAAGDTAGAVRVGPVQVVAARPSAAEVVTVDLVRTAVAGRELRVARQPVDPDRLHPDSAVAALVERATARSDSVGSRVVARIKLPLSRGARGASPLGELVADAQRNALRADIALVSEATLSGDLPAGPATYASLLSLHQASRPLVTATVTGSVLRQLLEAAVRDEAPAIHVSGAALRYDPRAQAGKRLRRVRLADGSTPTNSRRYTLALAEPLLRQPRFAALAGARIEPGNVTDVEALALYLRRLPQPVAPPESGRIETTR
jgi:2',3'-cyclic-nucleotide 2'-phosphodiesterase (5'-nucleotidase family)